MRYGSVDVLRRADVLGPARRGAHAARAQRRGQEHDDRDPRGLPDAVGGRGDGARRRPRPRRRGLARPARRGAAVVARPRPVAGATAAASTWPPTTRPTRRPERPRPMDVDELLEPVGLTEHGARRSARSPAASAAGSTSPIGIVGRPERALPRRAHDRLRPAGAPRLPRRRAPAGRPGGHDDPAHHPRPRRGREAGRPHPHPGRRPDHRRRQRRPSSPARSEGRTEVRWSRDGERFVHAAEGATQFVRELFAQYGDEVADLEVQAGDAWRTATWRW